MNSVRLLGLVVAWCGLLLFAPAVPGQQQVVVEAGRGVPERVRVLFEEAVATALPIMDSQLGLALKETTVRYVLVADRPALLEWYTSQLGYTRERAEALLWSTGRAIRERTGTYVVTRVDGFGRQGPDRVVAVRHVAHELTHIIQGALKGCPGIVPSWIVEGWAEWAGFRVVDLAGLRSYAQQRADRIAIMRSAFGRTVFPTLVQLDRAEWARLAQTRGAAATYGVALLAVERLIERVGSHEALDAYCLAARTEGRWASFERVFGISEPDYALDFLRFIRDVLGP